MDPLLLARVSDPYVNRIIHTDDDPVEVLYEWQGALISSAAEVGPAAGELYVALAELTDIPDSYPFDYGPNAVAVAREEIRAVAEAWTGVPQTVEGIDEYIRWLQTRLNDLPGIHGAEPHWPSTSQ